MRRRPPAAVSGTPPARHGSRDRTPKRAGAELSVGKGAHKDSLTDAREPGEAARRRRTTAHDIALDANDADLSPGQGQHGKTI